MFKALNGDLLLAAVLTDETGEWTVAGIYTDASGEIELTLLPKRPAAAKDARARRAPLRSLADTHRVMQTESRGHPLLRAWLDGIHQTVCEWLDGKRTRRMLLGYLEHPIVAPSGVVAAGLNLQSLLAMRGSEPDEIFRSLRRQADEDQELWRAATTHASAKPMSFSDKPQLCEPSFFPALERILPIRRQDREIFIACLLQSIEKHWTLVLSLGEAPRALGLEFDPSAVRAVAQVRQAQDRSSQLQLDAAAGRLVAEIIVDAPVVRQVLSGRIVIRAYGGRAKGPLKEASGALHGAVAPYVADLIGAMDALLGTK